jgi:HD-GYP domain-containing protein (c-di-GMP phosphodiesterase class II)
MVMPPSWLHFYGVGIVALVATAAAVALMTVGARQGDARTVVIGSAFSIMAAVLAVHGFATPGMIVGFNGLVALTGGATLPVGAVVLALATLPQLNARSAIRHVIVGQALVSAGILALSLVGMLEPQLVPGVPAPRTPVAIVLFVIGLVLFATLAVRSANTFLLTRRLADLSVVFGLVLLACSLYGALLLTFMDLGWWLGHLFELLGIALVGSSLAYDLHRGRRSCPLTGGLRAKEMVASEEAFLGARVRALMVRLAGKDTSTEEHTRRVASLAVEIGEELGLSPARLRNLAIGGLLHDMGKLSVASSILKKPGALTDDEFAVIKQHPERGRELLNELGGFSESVKRLVHDHHERLDGSGYPQGLEERELDLETRILAVSDVYDALVSCRVYRDAWPVEKALALLREESGTAFDRRVVDALVRLVESDVAALPAAALEPRLAKAS